MPMTDEAVALARLEERLSGHEHYIEARLTSERTLTTAEMRAVALEFQVYREETREHLQKLNHAHDLAQDDRGQFIDVKVFTPFLDDLTQWRRSVDRSLAKIVTWGAAAQVVMGIILSVVIVFLKQ